jgi:predicted Na+-dependent transporter
VVRKVLYTGMLPAREEFTLSMIGTLIALLLLPNLLGVLVQKKARKILLDTLESILAVCLIIVLLGIVLGLPVGEEHRFSLAGKKVM